MSEEDLKSRLLELGGEALARGKGEALDDAINQLVARRILVRENEIPRSSGERSELLAYHAAAPEPAPPSGDTACAENLSAIAGL